MGGGGGYCKKPAILTFSFLLFAKNTFFFFVIFKFNSVLSFLFFLSLINFEIAENRKIQKSERDWKTGVTEREKEHSNSTFFGGTREKWFHLGKDFRRDISIDRNLCFPPM